MIPAGLPYLLINIPVPDGNTTLVILPLVLVKEKIQIHYISERKFHACF